MISDLVRFRQDNDLERRRMMNAIDDLLMRLSHEREHPADVFRLVERELPRLRKASTPSRVQDDEKGWFKRTVAATVAIAAAYAGSEALGT
jgi:hypothetical protein